MAKFSYHGADFSLEVSKEQLTPHQAYHAKHSSWCPCGVEVPKSANRSKTTNFPIQVLFIGSLQEGKGILEILKTATILKAKGLESRYKFKIVGAWFSDEFAKEAMHYVESNSLDQLVEFPGQVTGEKKWETYRDADIFFFPTHYQSEATPIVIMEALGSGLPVISTLWSGIPDMLRGCVTADIMPIKSPSAYAVSIERMVEHLINDPKTYQHSRAFYEKYFLPEVFIGRVEEALIQTSKQHNS